MQQIATLRARVTQLESENVALRARVAREERENVELKKEKEELEEEKEELQKEKEGLEEENTDIRKETASLKKELEMWENRMEKVKTEIKRMRRQIGRDGPFLAGRPHGLVSVSFIIGRYVITSYSCCVSHYTSFYNESKRWMPRSGCHADSASP